jgi:putative endonuclease
MGAFVYMQRCSDGSLYIGSATGEDVAPRVERHNAGAFPGSYTWSRRPVTLVWCEHFERITDAIAAERQIKGWSRAKKMALANGEWDRVRQLAKRRSGRPAD